MESNKLPTFRQHELKFSTQDLLGGHIKSLVWRGNELVDWVGGGIRFGLGGAIQKTNHCYAYRFDSAVGSPSGEYAVIYERFGTKGLILRHGTILREINRSYYCAESYDYPVTIFTLPDGREVIAHCPEEYGDMEIEELETGRRLTARVGKGQDFFHSRIASNPSGSRLLSAGWVWHPFDAVVHYETECVLREPTLLDCPRHFKFRDHSSSINSACFLDDDRVVLSSAPDADDFFDDESPEVRAGRLTPGTLAVFNLLSDGFESIQPVEGVIGEMMPVGTDYVVGFYEFPKLIQLSTGRIVQSWPKLKTGLKNSSIGGENLPPLALDFKNARFAVASAMEITVVEFQTGDR